jgi:GTP-binding protein
MQFNEAKFVGSFYDISQIPNTNFPQVAFVGCSNVGKSSMINRMLNRKQMAKVAKTAGKTRSLNLYEADGRYYLVDLPGYGFAKVAADEIKKWEKLIESYLDAAKNLRGVIHVIDSRRGIRNTDIDLIKYMSTSKLNIIWVLSKADKLSSQEKAKVFRETVFALDCSPQNVLFFSAVDNTGVSELRNTIAEMLGR